MDHMDTEWLLVNRQETDILRVGLWPVRVWEGDRYSGCWRTVAVCTSGEAATAAQRLMGRMERRGAFSAAIAVPPKPGWWVE